MLVQPSSDPVTQVEPESQTVEVAAARRGGMASAAKAARRGNILRTGVVFNEEYKPQPLCVYRFTSSGLHYMSSLFYQPNWQKTCSQEGLIK